jgi:hypothetical protein
MKLTDGAPSALPRADFRPPCDRPHFQAGLWLLALPADCCASQRAFEQIAGSSWLRREIIESSGFTRTRCACKLTQSDRLSHSLGFGFLLELFALSPAAALAEIPLA